MTYLNLNSYNAQDPNFLNNNQSQQVDSANQAKDGDASVNEGQEGIRNAREHQKQAQASIMNLGSKTLPNMQQTTMATLQDIAGLQQQITGNGGSSFSGMSIFNGAGATGASQGLSGNSSIFGQTQTNPIQNIQSPQIKSVIDLLSNNINIEQQMFGNQSQMLTQGAQQLFQLASGLGGEGAQRIMAGAQAIGQGAGMISQAMPMLSNPFTAAAGAALMARGVQQIMQGLKTITEGEEKLTQAEDNTQMGEEQSKQLTELIGSVNEFKTRVQDVISQINDGQQNINTNSLDQFMQQQSQNPLQQNMMLQGNINNNGILNAVS